MLCMSCVRTEWTTPLKLNADNTPPRIWSKEWTPYSNTTANTSVDSASLSLYKDGADLVHSLEGSALYPLTALITDCVVRIQRTFSKVKEVHLGTASGGQRPLVAYVGISSDPANRFQQHKVKGYVLGMVVVGAVDKHVSEVILADGGRYTSLARYIAGMVEAEIHDCWWDEAIKLVSSIRGTISGEGDRAYIYVHWGYEDQYTSYKRNARMART